MLSLDATVTRAYLARVVYDDKTSGVMLGLLRDGGRDCEKLAGQMGRTVAALFNTRADLDIVFLSDERDAEIRKACPPSMTGTRHRRCRRAGLLSWFETCGVAA